MEINWFKQCMKYVGLECGLVDSGGGGEVGDPGADPGPVDNTPLFKATLNTSVTCSVTVIGKVTMPNVKSDRYVHILH